MHDRLPFSGGRDGPYEITMLDDRTFSPAPAQVTIGFIDGRTHVGHVARFSPSAPQLMLLLSVGPASRNLIAAEQVAYVAFHRASGEPPARRNARRGELKIHAAGQKTFIVDRIGEDAPGEIGMYTRPAEPGSPYREIFFYNHGINAKEVNEPLGAMLVRDGMVDVGQLNQGLAQQSNDGRTPIGQILIARRSLDSAALEQATELQKRKGTRLGEVLIEAGLATSEDIEKALSEQRRRGGRRIGQILVDMNLVSEVDLSMTLAKKFQLPFVDLDKCSINLAALEELPKELIEKNRVMPVDSDAKSITLAIADPLAVDAIDLVRVRSGKQVCEVVVTPSQLEKYIPTYLDQFESKKVASEMDGILKVLAIDDAQLGVETDTAETSQVADTDNAIIKLANQIIIDAYRRGASDIHVEPNGKERTTMVRFRIDGDCLAYQEIPSTYRLPLVARFKIMAQLDISERRKPQDGKIRFKIAEKQIELRVATIPTVNGNEDLVLRILAASKPIPLVNMGLSKRNLSTLEGLITKPYGLILCVGPTGSGKTTTLHSALGAINTIDTKIWTAEDPVEITQPGLRQVQVNAKIGFTFANAMRAFLRADPDVIMVGEMRDHETASTAIEASLTGHLVFSTLHTNSAPETVTRLIDMGLDPFSFADALLGVLAQRLARSLCKQCREAYRATDAEVEELRDAYGRDAFDRVFAGDVLAGIKLWKPVGCEACHKTGYRGRVAVHELLATDDSLKLAIQRKAPVAEVRSLACDGGMTTLLQDGIEKVMAGATDLKQILAVCMR
jgi:type II secretory ATPase GspE/PulE/Tfp pilus assembly ATPase PilB-like protein